MEFPNPGKKNKSSRLLILLAGLSFLIPLTLIYLYRNYAGNFKIQGIEIKKLVGEENSPDTVSEKGKSTDSLVLLYPFKRFKLTRDTVKIAADSSFLGDSITVIKTTVTPIPSGYYSDEESGLKKPIPVFTSDTTKHRIMIMGDSQCGGLCFPLNDYCVENGHRLIMSLVWNSATIMNYAYADTVNSLINKYKPTFIFLVLGLNEIEAKDLANRKKAADLLVKKLNGIPYAWIGPANWKEDYGINKVFRGAADSNSFFLTRGMNLPRGGDGRHPNNEGYRLWMDSIATWLSCQAKFKVALRKPSKRNPFKSPIITLNAAKFRGF